MPQIESIKRMIAADELWPISDAWDRHCTTSGDAMHSMDEIERTVAGLYGEPKDLEDFVRKAHAVDYDATRAMFEAFRVNTPVSTGVVQWMLNSAWPSIYWQLYDYYGAPTAGYYGTKKGCEPIQLIYNYKDRNVYLVNDGKDAMDVTASVKVYDENSKLLHEQECTLATSYRNTVKAFDLSQFQGKAHVVSLEIADVEGKVITDNFYTIGAKPNVYDPTCDLWYMTTINEFTNLKYTFSQSAVDMDMTIGKENGEYVVTLVNKSNEISFLNILKAKDSDGNLVVPAYWSDNFFPLFPGQTKIVTCRTDAKDICIECEK